MTPDDLHALNRIDRDAFEHYRRRHGQLNRALRLRTAENMRAAVHRPHAGVVVEWPAGRVVGYCFTHVWGSFGWLGTLGVLPDYQGRGLGQTVIAAGLDALDAAGCTTLALETMPESGKNLALYARLELEVRRLTLIMQGSVPPAPAMRFVRWQGDPAPLCAVGHRLLPGLDPTPAARWLAAEDGGETLVWLEDGQPSAFAVLRSTSRRSSGMHPYLTAEAVGCVPDAVAHWPRYLAEMQAFAIRQHKTGLVFPVNGQQSALLRALLAERFRVVYTRVRMARGAVIGAPDARFALTLAM